MLDKWSITCADIFLALFTVYIFFLYFDIFFVRKKKNICVRVGIITLLLWQLIIPNIIHRFPIGYNIGITVLLTLFTVTNIYDGKGWIKCFFGISFDAIWMLVETLVGAVLIIYSANIVELQPVGSLISKVIFFIVIMALKKVFSNEKIKELPRAHNLLIVLIPIGSIFIMDIVFRMAYRA